MTYSGKITGTNTVIRFIWFTLLLLVSSLIFSCRKNNNGYAELVMSVPEHNAKTHLVPDVQNRLFDVVWDNGDQVKVYDQDGGSGVYTNLNVYNDGNHEVAHFGGEGVDISRTIAAFYPSSIGRSMYEFVLPYEQTYRSKNDGYVFDYPMWGKETDNDHIWFRNLTGLLILRLRGQSGTEVRRVYVIDPSDPHAIGMRGTYSVSCSGSTRTNNVTVNAVSPYYDIMLNCTSNPATLSETESSMFYFSVPEGSHTKLLIGIEYRLPATSEWHTIYQTIFAQTYGERTFDFERSKWTPLDVNITDLDPSLIYTLEDVEFNPSPVSDTVVNTGTKLTTAFHEYTFAIDLTPDDVSSLDNNGYLRKTIYSEMDNTQNSWNGILIRLAKQNNRGDVKIEVDIGNGTSVFSTVAITNGVRHQFVVTISEYSNTRGTATVYFKRNGTVASANARFNKTAWVTTSNPEPQIGGDQHISGRYFDGTIHSFRIYDRVWTAQEINSFITQ